MEIIVTHINADFDAMASQVAAQKLYPDALIVVPRVSRPVRDFLALHKDSFKLTRFSEIDLNDVTRLILVDVRRVRQLRDVQPLLKRVREGEQQVEIVIYDHHPSSLDDVIGHVEVIEPVGSAATLLIEEIQRRDIQLDSMEATLMAIGIHTDTGSLTYANTTSRDAQALAWLLGQGVSLKMVNRYMSVAYTLDQRALLSDILATTEVYDYHGVEIGFATVPLPKMVDNISGIASQAAALSGYDAMFCIFPVKKGKRVLVVARARAPYIDVSQLLSALGGGGHPGAASATIKGGDPETIEKSILDALEIEPPRPRVVADVMSSPVHSVDPKLPLSVLKERLQQWRYTGVPVLKVGKLVGIISRRDLESAERKGHLHLGVGSCMSSNVKSIGPLDPVENALKIMVDADVGRLPVLDEGGHLMGIITRTDLLKLLY